MPEFNVKIAGFDSEIVNISKTEDKKYPFAISIKGTEIHCFFVKTDKDPPTTKMRNGMLEKFPGSKPEREKIHVGKASKKGIKWSFYYDQDFHDNIKSKITSKMEETLAGCLGTTKNNLNFIVPDSDSGSTVESTQSTSTSKSAKPTWADAKEEWRKASDEADRQITVMQDFLKDTGEDDLVSIGESGLNSITGDYKVLLMAGMQDIDKTSGGAQAEHVKKALDTVKGFRSYIKSSEAFDAIDENSFKEEGYDFNEKMTLRSTLTKALNFMEGVLESMESN